MDLTVSSVAILSSQMLWDSTSLLSVVWEFVWTMTDGLASSPKWTVGKQIVLGETFCRWFWYKYISFLFCIVRQPTHSMIASDSCPLLPAWRRSLSSQTCHKVLQEQRLPLSSSRSSPGFVVVRMMLYHFSNSESDGLAISLVAFAAVPSPLGAAVLIPQICWQCVWKSPASKVCIGSIAVKRIGFQ